jgi:hypothetical protein
VKTCKEDTNKPTKQDLKRYTKKAKLADVRIPSKCATPEESQLLSVSPDTKRAENTNALAFGLGIFRNDYTCAGERPFVALPDTVRYPDALATATRTKFSRHPISGDYFFVLYDAARNKAGWYDYRDPIKLDPQGFALPPHEIPLSGWNFLPTVYSREKIAVHVCNLRISDSLTVTMSPTPMPENGADFRGASPSTAVSLAAATDSLLSSGATGVSAGPGTLGYSSSPALSAAATAGYSAGVTSAGKPNSDGTIGTPSYTDATITIAPDQLANLMSLLVHDSKSVQTDVAQFQLGTSPGGVALPGSIDHVSAEATALFLALPAVPAGVVQTQENPEYNPGMFNHYVDETSALAGEVNAIGTALTSTSLGARAETIRTNFATLHGIVQLAKSIEDTDDKLNTAAGSSCTNAQPTVNALCTSVGQAQGAAKCPPDAAAMCTDLTTAVARCGAVPLSVTAICAKVGQAQVASGKSCTQIGLGAVSALCTANSLCTQSAAPDTASCKVFEEQTFHRFLSKYCAGIGLPDNAAHQHNPTCFDYGVDYAESAVVSVDRLHTDLATLDSTVGAVFERMNDWYSNSRIDATDVLTPAGTNSVERINILIHRTYLPFTVVGSSQLSSSVAGTGGGSAGGATSSAATGAGGASGGFGGTGGGAGGGAASASGGGAGASAAGGAGGGGATASASTSAAGGAAVVSNAGFTAETVLMEVHRRANFNIVGGALAMHIPTNNYTLVPEVASQTPNANTATGQPPYIYPTKCNGVAGQNVPVATPTSGPWPASEPYYCIARQQATSWQAAAMVGVAWFPLGRDYFPYGTGGSIRRLKNYSPSLLGATSVTSLGNFFLGPDVEPANGVNFFAGVAAGHQNTLPSGVSLNTPLLPVGASNSPPALPTATHEKWGISLGVAFDVNVFTQIFGKASGASAP